MSAPQVSVLVRFGRRFRAVGLAAVRSVALSGTVLAATLSSGSAVAQGVAVEAQDLEAWSSERLGSTLSSIAADITGGQAILPQQLEIAFGLAEIAT